MRNPLSISAALYLSLHVAASLFPGRLWGVDALAYQPEWVVPFAVLSLLLLATTAGDKVPAQVFRLLDSAPGYALPLALLALSALSFSVFLTQTHLLGDGSLLVRELALGAESPENRAPLSLFLIQQVYKLIGDVLTTYRAVSLLSGLCFVWLVYRFARELSEDAGSRFWVAALLLSQGYFVLFAGYVETYSLLFAASALYIYVALRCVRGAVAPLYPVIVLSFAICVHVAAISLVPSLLALVYVRRDQLEPRMVGSIAILSGLRGAGSIAIMPVLVISLLLLLDYPFSGGDEGFLVSQHILPIWSVGTMAVAYALLDGSHFADLANALFLAAPAFVVGIPLVIGRRDWDRLDLWLGTLCIPPLLMTWVINPEIGAFRDWDILAYPVLFLTVALGRWVSHSTSGSRRNMMLLIGVSVLHLAP